MRVEAAPAPAVRRHGGSRVVVLLLVLAASVTGCATRSFVRPVGPGVPVDNAGLAWAEATRACREIRTYHQELRLSARIESRRFPGVTLGLALDSSSRIGLGAFAMGQPLFQLGGTAAESTLWLREGNRVVTGPAVEMVEALIGVRLGPERLLSILSGCVTGQETVERAERVSELLAVTAGDSLVYLEPVAGLWRPRAGFFEGLAVDYQRYDAALPRQIAITSEPGREPAVALTIRVEGDLRPNPPLDPAQVFTVRVPPGAVPASMEALRAAGPLADYAQAP